MRATLKMWKIPVGFLLSLVSLYCLAGAKLDLPFWKSGSISGDTLFFIREEGQAHPAASLLLVPKNAPRLTSATRDFQYVLGKDFTWKPGSRLIELPAGSKISFKTHDEMYPNPNADTSFATSSRHPGKVLLFAEGHVFHDVQVVATYETKEHWTGIAPGKKSELLPKTIARLKNKESINLVVLGDSISAGANASGFIGAKPNIPAYPDLVAHGLQALGSSRVALRNLSVGGTRSEWGVTRVPDVLLATPDLLIIAFGMNDTFHTRDTGAVSPEQYRQNILKIIKETREARPGCEFILVAPMIGNEEWDDLQQDRFAAYRDELEGLEGPGVAVADVTSLWAELLKRKSFYDLIGNGLNHPNDFGHRVYSEVILELVSR
jgi:lysophospholipase L1-like esterase